MFSKLLLAAMAVAVLGVGVAASSAALSLAAAAPVARGVRPAGTQLTIYLVRGERVSPVRRVVPSTHAVARATLLALLRGPTASERRAGYGSAVPAGTRLRDLAVHGHAATVDLTRRFESGGGSASMLLRVAQVVFSATQFAIDRVAFRLNGVDVKTIGGEGIVVAPAVGRAAFEAQTPPILVESPLPGDHVGRSFTVRGSANVFEARLLVDLRAGSTVVARRRLLASAGSGTRGTFSTRLTVPAADATFTVVVYSHSPKDGAQVNVIRVPVSS